MCWTSRSWVRSTRIGVLRRQQGNRQHAMVPSSASRSTLWPLCWKWRSILNRAENVYTTETSVANNEACTSSCWNNFFCCKKQNVCTTISVKKTVWVLIKFAKNNSSKRSDTSHASSIQQNWLNQNVYNKRSIHRQWSKQKSTSMETYMKLKFRINCNYAWKPQWEMMKHTSIVVQ